MFCAGGCTGTGPVESMPGCRIGNGLLSLMNGRVHLSSGTGCCDGMGRTISGVMMIISSELLLVMVLL